MTPQMRKDLMRFEQLREQFRFLRENNIATKSDMAAYETKTEEMLTRLLKRRTILNVRKRKRRKLFTALADMETLADVPRLQIEGVPGMEDEAVRYSEAVAVLDKSGIDQETLKQEKAGLYNQLAEVSLEIRDVRKKLKMCAEINEKVPEIQRDIQIVEPARKKVRQTKVR